MKSNLYIVECANYALNNKFGYWYGTFSQEATANLLKEKRAQYPNYYDQSRYNIKFTDQIAAHIRVVDCAGLLKFGLWTNRPSEMPKYNSSQDLSANGFIKNGCSETGDISTLPRIPGIILWKEGHLGISLGDGEYAIEARGHDYGVQKTRIADRGWQKWGKCKFVEYPTATRYTAEQAISDIKKVVDKYYAQ